jgi:iron complex transport system ATP-binding protein
VSEPILTLTDVGFAYPGAPLRRVLDRATLGVSPGELVALLGPNGSGKTTLLRLAAGLLEPDTGTVELDGRAMADWSRVEVARQVAVLSQSGQLAEGFRVEEIVSLGRAPHAKRRFGLDDADEQAVGRALHEAGAMDLVGRRVEDLSGGERQRVLVALALAQEPAVPLLDEPTVHLDVRHQQALLATLTTLCRQRGLAVVAVLHDLALARSAASRVAVLGDGRVVADGPPGEVLTEARVASAFGLSAASAAIYAGAAGD